MGRYTNKVREQRTKNLESLAKGHKTLFTLKGIPSLNRMVPGIVPGEKIIVTGRTGAGKSTFTRFISTQIADQCEETGVKVIIVENILEEPVTKVVVKDSMKLLASEGVKVDFASYYGYMGFRTSFESNPRKERIYDRGLDLWDEKYDGIKHIWSIPNPDSFWIRLVEEILSKEGTFYYKGEEVDGEYEEFDEYIWNQPTQLLVTYDTFDKHGTSGKRTVYESGFHLYHEIICRRIGIICNAITFLVQQQEPIKSYESMNKAGKSIENMLFPKLAQLKKNRSTQESGTLIFALFWPGNPEHNLKRLETIPITDFNAFKGRFIVLSLLKIREGDPEGANKIPLIMYPIQDNFVEINPRNKEDSSYKKHLKRK